jgi:anti-sigma B factor antagonist
MAFSFELESKKDYATVIPSGSLLSVFDGKDMLEAVDKDLINHKNFIVDLGKVNHLSSEGLNVLLHILTRSRNSGGETILCNLSTHLESLLIITKLSNIFTITKDKKTAAAKLQKEDSK